MDGLDENLDPRKKTDRLDEEGAKNDSSFEFSAQPVQNLASKSSLAERVAAKGGFTAPSLIIAKTIEPTSSSAGVKPPYFTIPPGLSPTPFLDSPVFLSNSLAQLSPTTGKLSLAILGEDLSFPSPEIVGQSPQNVSAPHSASKEQSGNIVAKFPCHLQLLPSIETFRQQGEMNSTLAEAATSDDGYNWRKYGQKQVKGSKFPRVYYKCVHVNCPIKKKIQCSDEGNVAEIIYKGSHNHPKPLTAASSVNLATQDGQAECSKPVINVSSSESKEEEEENSVTQRCLFDDEEDETESKRRKMVSCVNGSGVTRASREPRVVVQTTSEVDILDDGYRWRKYGQKVVKGNPNPRSYYKCTSAGCNVRKHVERASHDVKSVITAYEGKHNHEVPAPKNSNNQEMYGGQIYMSNIALPAQSKISGLQLHSSMYGSQTNIDYGMNLMIRGVDFKDQSGVYVGHRSSAYR